MGKFSNRHFLTTSQAAIKSLTGMILARMRCSEQANPGVETVRLLQLSLRERRTTSSLREDRIKLFT